jgi:hypothetical protein
MIECLMLGDSIAVGVGQRRPECRQYAKVGINSEAFNKRYKLQEFGANTVLISLGSNDYEGIDTYQELTELRKKVKAKQVFWVLPANNLEVAEIVESIANLNKDVLIKIPYLSKDRVHPTPKGYKRIADITKNF